LLSSAALGALLVTSVPAAAAASVARLDAGDSGLTYVQARAAAMNGDHARAATLLATLVEGQPDQVDIARKALSEAIGAGQIDLALDLSRRIDAASLPTDARLLLVADEVKRRRLDHALGWLAVKGDGGDLAFIAPLLSAWDAAERGDDDKALASIAQIPGNGLLAPLRAEQQALILLKLKRPADAEAFARRAIGSGGGRETRLRLAFADAFLAAGDRPRALAMIDGMDSGAAEARARIEAGKPSGEIIDTSAKALSSVLTAFAGDLSRMQRAAPPIGLVQVARYADPENSAATALLALLLDARDRTDEALALLRGVPQDDPLIGDIRDVQVKILLDSKRFDDAYAIAAPAAARSDAGVGDYSRLGEVYGSMKRNDLAADTYARAIALAKAQGLKSELWPLLLFRANALEEANRWPEAKQALLEGLALEPAQPLLLNFLGYAKLEHGEDVDAAEAMIRKASELAPGDASIIDSLGWAQFKRGKVDEAIATLQEAASKDPAQAEIQEHLGDALYKSGRRYEARFAWRAALVTAEDEIETRVKAKLDGGLTSANAAP
jgi:tetratricopeptide (TPR) repeat protein